MMMEDQNRILHTNMDSIQSIDDEKDLTRTKSTESMDNFDISESNILSSLFDGIPINTNNSDNKIAKKLKCVNVPRSKQTSKSILMKTGFREPDEIRIIFKKRPLGIQIKPLNIHGFGAKISKITNNNVYKQGVKENMIITGLNNKDLLGCTFDQIVNIIKLSTPPITLRLKKIKKKKQIDRLPSKSSNIRYPSYGPQRDKIININDRDLTETVDDINCVELPNITPTALMLASFSRENMPISTILSSSSDEEEMRNNKNTSNMNERIREEEEEDDNDNLESDEEEEDDDGISYVNWNNIRLGASVIKYGWALDIENEDEDEITFEMAYNTLTRQGLNIYEIRAAFRLIREQPEQIPMLETFKQLTINHNISHNNNPKFMPQQWLKEHNLTGYHESDHSSSSTEQQPQPQQININNNNNNYNDNDNDNDNYNDDEEIKPKQPISGYIDFFDDNETSVSESQSISRSIQVQQMFEVIGLKSPPIENMAALYSSDDDDDDDDEGDDDDTNDNKLGIIKNSNGEIVFMDKRGNVITTPDGAHFNDDMDFYGHINFRDHLYLDEYDEFDEYDEEEEDDDVDDDDDDFEEDEENIVSYICTEGADMIDNECLPQVMLKCESMPITNNNFNLIHHLKNNKLNELKRSIRGLSISNNVKSIFKKISSPKGTESDPNKYEND